MIEPLSPPNANGSDENEQFIGGDIEDQNPVLLAVRMFLCLIRCVKFTAKVPLHFEEICNTFCSLPPNERRFRTDNEKLSVPWLLVFVRVW